MSKVITKRTPLRTRVTRSSVREDAGLDPPVVPLDLSGKGTPKGLFPSPESDEESIVDERLFLRSRPPELDTDNFIQWKRFFLLHLHGRGQAAKALSPRPARSNGFFIHLSDEVEANRKLKAAQTKWDKRNIVAFGDLVAAIRSSPTPCKSWEGFLRTIFRCFGPELTVTIRWFQRR